MKLCLLIKNMIFRKKKLLIFFIFPTLILFFCFLSVYLKRASNPNILFITIDALRPDHLSCYGYRRNTSPNIDGVAQEGVIFSEAISQGASTIPSLPSIMYSRYFRTNNMAPTLDSIKNVKIPFSTIFEILQSKGYFTVVACAHPAFQPLFYTDSYYCQKGLNKIIEFDDVKPHAWQVTNRVIRWLKKYCKKPFKKPFFLWIHYMDTHTPYILPLCYKAKFCWDELMQPPCPIKILTRPPWIGGIPLPYIEYNITDFRYYIAQYDGAISLVDEYIGFIIEYLKENNLWNNTLVIISADHGEAMGEHDFYLVHSLHLYDEFIRVPLIIKLPKNLVQSKRIEQQVELIDIVPTILDILGIKKYNFMQGESLLPLILNDGNYNKKYAFSNAGVLRCVRTSQWKLIFDESNNSYEMYDLGNDPKERTNLIGISEYEEEFNILKNELNKWLNQEPFYPFSEENINEEVKRALRSLGYTQ